MNKPKSIRDKFIETQCEQKEASDRYGVYENDGELVADWFLNEFKERIEGIGQTISGFEEEGYAYEKKIINETLEKVIKLLK